MAQVIGLCKPAEKKKKESADSGGVTVTPLRADTAYRFSVLYCTVLYCTYTCILVSLYYSQTTEYSSGHTVEEREASVACP